MIAPRMSIGDRPHLVYPERPVHTKDREGGYTTETWHALSPAEWYVSLEPLSGGGQQVAAGTMTSTIGYTVTGPYHPELTTECRLRFEDQGRTRLFQVTGAIVPGVQQQETIAQVVELITYGQ